MAFGGPGGPGGGCGPGGPGGFGGPGHGGGFGSGHGGPGPGGFGSGGPGPGGHFGGPGGFHGGFHSGFHSGPSFFGHGFLGGFGFFGHHGEHGHGDYDDLEDDFSDAPGPYHLIDRLMDKIFARQPILAPEQQCDYLPTPRATAIAGTMALLTLIQGCAMFASNILATKIWHLGPFVVDGGLLLFPFTYVIGDVIVELFRHKTANRILSWVCAINAIGLAALLILRFLPDASGIDNSAINTVFAHSTRIFLGSIIAFITSGRINNAIYERLRRYTTARQIKSRAWVSSFFARLADTTLFTIIGFAGRGSGVSGILQQIAGSFFVGMILETCMLPLTVWLVYGFKSAMDY